MRLALLFFLLTLTGLSHAQGTIWASGSGMVFRGADGRIGSISLPTNWVPGPGTGGGATVSSSKSVALAGAGRLSPVGTRVVASSALARVGVGVAKRLGPIGLGLTLAGLIWDGDEWLESEDTGEIPLPPGETIVGACISTPIGVVVYSGSSACVRVPSHIHGCTGSYLAWPTSGYIQDQSLPCGVSRIGVFESFQPQEPVTSPASDSAIEAAILEALIAAGNGQGVLERLRQQGLDVTAGPESVSGPTTINGSPSTTSTSGPAGITTVTSTPTYHITYEGDTVTINTTTVTTTTYPDNTTETTTTTTDSPGDEAKEPTDFCVEHPGSIVCQEMDTPAEVIPEGTEIEFSITPTGGFGGNGSCPSDVSLSYLGQPLSWSYQPACDFFSGVRPAVVAISWIVAIIIALGGYRQEG